MTRSTLLKLISQGEDSVLQFKLDVTNPDSLAAELVAMANGKGGQIVLGVADDGSLPGLSAADVRRLNQVISNAATQNMRSPISPRTENVPVAKGRVVIVIHVPEGLDKPYFDRSGVIWLKAGADKRRLNSKEELRRLFQSAGEFHADELPTKAGIEKLDTPRFREFLHDAYRQPLPRTRADLTRLLQNMDLATADGRLNLAGALLFAKNPERIKPQFILKAIRYPGTTIHSTRYLDTEDFVGPFRSIFDGAMAFISRNLRKEQASGGVNSPGVPEIPPSVFEELLVNALVHRDYLISAPIRLFVFDDRIEIISPGHLPNNLTVERIRSGISNIRNPILISYVAKGLLPYRGLGSGITRALRDWPDIVFLDDRDGCQFTAAVARKPAAAASSRNPAERLDATREKTREKTRDKILRVLAVRPEISMAGLTEQLGISTKGVEWQIREMKKAGILKRIGPDKGGHWEVVNL
jgi:ATP-dependent DNA helicase RecG